MCRWVGIWRQSLWPPGLPPRQNDPSPPSYPQLESGSLAGITTLTPDISAAPSSDNVPEAAGLDPVSPLKMPVPLQSDIAEQRAVSLGPLDS